MQFTYHSYSGSSINIQDTSLCNTSDDITTCKLLTCDMITRNESDVGNIDFELQAKKGDKFSCFIVFLNVKALFISLQPHVRLKWALDQNVVF